MKKDFITFKPKGTNKVKISVKRSFVKDCPNYKNISLKDLIEKHSLLHYFHNNETFAAVDEKIGSAYYFLNGQVIDDKETFDKEVKELKGDLK